MIPVRADIHYVYVLQSRSTGYFYTGCTNNLRKRLEQNQSGKVSSTISRGPFSIVYFEYCLNKADAYSREKYLKTGMGKRYIKNRLKRFLALTG